MSCSPDHLVEAVIKVAVKQRSMVMIWFVKPGEVLSPSLFSIVWVFWAFSLVNKSAMAAS
jgi:hypothetical protein